MTRSDSLARRALGFALDPTVSRDQAAARLFQLAGAHARTLELARVRMLRSAPTGPIAEAAIAALRFAFRNAEESGGVSETVKERLALRARRDDTETAVAQRLEQYDQNTVPVLTWYEARTSLLRVDGDRPTDRVSAELRHQVHALRRGRTDPALCRKVHRFE